MKKMSLSLIAAGVMAAASFAHADAIFYPDGRVVDLGVTGADTLALDSSSMDTTVLGAGPASSVTTTTTVTPQYEYVYVQPNINFDRSVALSQVHRNAHLMHRGDAKMRHQAAATFNTPARAGEASTMTGGAPNVSTDNRAMVVGSYNIPYNVVSVDGPYYVFSY
jgi:hypothetical protein